MLPSWTPTAPASCSRKSGSGSSRRLPSSRRKAPRSSPNRTNRAMSTRRASTNTSSAPASPRIWPSSSRRWSAPRRDWLPVRTDCQSRAASRFPTGVWRLCPRLSAPSRSRSGAEAFSSRVGRGTGRLHVQAPHSGRALCTLARSLHPRHDSPTIPQPPDRDTHRLARAGGLQHSRVAGFLEDLAHEPVHAGEAQLDDDRAVGALSHDAAGPARPARPPGGDPYARAARGLHLAGAQPAVDLGGGIDLGTRLELVA